MKKHTVEEFSRLIKSKKDLYEACERNGWYLPKLKSTIVTEDYLRKVITGKVYCLKFEDVRMKACPVMPYK